MDTVGTFTFESAEDARAQYESIGPAAQTVVREVAKAMEFDREEYDDRVTSDVVETARDVLFAEQLAVTVGTDAEFDAWRDEHGDEFEVIGSENVDHVAWHAPPFSDGVAATFQDRPDAAVGTLRRQAFGRIYGDVV